MQSKLRNVGWFTWLLSCQALASDGVDLFDLSLEDLMAIEVTGSTLTKEDRLSVPAAVSVFSRDEIHRLGVESLEELMPFVPGFQTYRGDSSGNQMLFSARGRRLNEVGGEVLVLIDGERVADPRTGGIAGLLSRIPTANVKRVEFIRGPGSVIYGSNAMQGVINIITVEDSREVAVSLSDQETRKGHWIGALKSGGVSLDWFVQAIDDNGEEYQVPDSFTPTRITTSDPRRNLDLSMKLGWEDTQLQLMHMERNSEDFYNLELLSNGFNETDTQYSDIAIVQAMHFGAVESELRASYVTIDTEINTQLTGMGDLAAVSLPSSIDPFRGIADLASDEARLFLTNDWTINQDSSLQFGAEYRTLQVNDAVAHSNYDLAALVAGNFPITSYTGFDNVTSINQLDSQDVSGLFAQYQHALSKDTHATLGIRYDTYSSIGSNLSKRFGLVHDLDDENTFKLLYGEAFRAPGMSETGLINNPIEIGNPELQPETVQTGDLIWIHHGAKHYFSLGYFENHFTDAIIEVPVNTTTRTLANSEESPTKGAEFEFQYRIDPQWTTNTTLTHLMETTDSSYREAADLASLTLFYQKNAWSFNGAMFYQGTRTMAVGAQRLSLDSFWLTSLHGGYAFGDGWESFLTVNNLFDEDAQVPPIGVSVTEGIPIRGRELFLGVRWNY